VPKQEQVIEQHNRNQPWNPRPNPDGGFIDINILRDVGPAIREFSFTVKQLPAEGEKLIHTAAIDAAAVLILLSVCIVVVVKAIRGH
jgi:hypothetical protein